VTRAVKGPDGREWVVRSYRFRRPPWRSFGPDLPEMGPLDMVLYLPVGFLRVLVLPLLAFLAEAPFALLLAAFGHERYVEASCPAPQPSRLTWRVPAEHLSDIVDQVARQLELGYGRITPHNADFLGFG
jgi:hypothetical protein